MSKFHNWIKICWDNILYAMEKSKHLTDLISDILMFIVYSSHVLMKLTWNFGLIFLTWNCVFYPHKESKVSYFIIFSITSLILSFINLYAFFFIIFPCFFYVELVVLFMKGYLCCIYLNVTRIEIIAKKNTVGTNNW